MWIGTLGGHQSVTVAKLKILIQSTPQRKKGKSLFENGGKLMAQESLQESIATNS